MSKLQTLTPDIVEKIVDGEVISRPASVIKELLENSIDADAGQIAIELENAGKSQIRIIDNGHGIEKDDLESIFARYTTSKIQSMNDLLSINSFGFRGEALYNVAKVSDVIVKTKTDLSETGWGIHMRGSQRIDLSPCSFSKTGTEITINDLFFNTPDRKKTLEGEKNEIDYILNTITPYTLLFPQCSFTLKHHKKKLLEVKSTEYVKKRIAQTLKLKEKHLRELIHMDEKKRILFHIVVEDIKVRKNRDNSQFIFINNRPVTNKNISHHINQAFRLLKSKTASNFFAIYLTVPTEEIDVNIEPSKREVKIKNESDICLTLRGLAEQLLTKSKTFSLGKEKKAPYDLHEEINKSLNEYQLKPQENKQHTQDAGKDSSAFVRGNHIPTNEENHHDVGHKDLFEKQDESLENKMKIAKLIGLFANKYILYESGKSLLLVDQHLAAERITYEKLISQMEAGNIEIQPLLSPIVVNVNAQELCVWEQSVEKLDEIGFATTQWSAQSIAIHSHPNLLKDPEHALKHLLVGESIKTSNHDSLARRACRASILSEDILKKEKIQSVKDELLSCLDPFTCPHGKPTVVEMTESSFDKHFLRS